MTPILVGRWQTRLATLATLGVLVTLVFALAFDSLAFFAVIFWVVVFGLAWDLVYDLLQSFRWDRDWPAAFHVATGVIEGVLLFVVISVWGLPGIPVGSVSLPLFIAHYGTVWLIIFAWVEGPMRAFFPFWRFHGGRLLPVVGATDLDRRHRARHALRATGERRPSRITVVGLLFLAGAVLVGTYGTLLLIRPELVLDPGSFPTMPDVASITSAAARVVGVIVLLVAIVYLAVGMGLMAGRGWARVTGFVLAFLLLFLTLFGLALVVTAAQPATGGEILSTLAAAAIYTFILVALAKSGPYFGRQTA